MLLFELRIDWFWGDISWKAIPPIAIDACTVPYSLFVCLSVTFVHCAQTTGDIDTISFAYCLFQIVLTFGLHRSALPAKIFALKWPTSWFERRRHSIANCGRMVVESIGVDFPGAVGANAPIGKGSVGACTQRKKLMNFFIYRVYFFLT